ncbi:MAG: 23S rRNA (adenine(2503)-C(2))-methyltransferase RlmN [Clostridia bacterium]|nr:23S rRNA (adenine(2503)-C(2))-methyltransferase RlmN [Clostridia bacterium]
MIDIKSMRRDELRACLTERGWQAFRADQIRSWLHRGVTDFDAMTNLPADLRRALASEFVIPSVSVERRLVSAIDGTVKYLFSLPDGEAVESVLMDYKHGWSQCLSTQVGCRMGCSFCATGMEGLARNLLPSEMMAQIEAAQADRGIRVSSIVLMGMGEPLDNYDNVLRFLEMLGEEGGVQIGQRHVSLSTCGLVDKIRDLQKLNLQLTLSVSLHAPNDDIRRRLMPIARKWSIEELLDACRDYAEATSRRISFEYAMFDGVNDSDACARELAQRLRGMLCHVNLIPANAVEGTDNRRSERARLQAFCDILSARGITTTVRRTLGADISASCGQLRRGERAAKG